MIPSCLGLLAGCGRRSSICGYGPVERVVLSFDTLFAPLARVVGSGRLASARLGRLLACPVLRRAFVACVVMWSAAAVILLRRLLCRSLFNRCGGLSRSCLLVRFLFVPRPLVAAACPRPLSCLPRVPFVLSYSSRLVPSMGGTGFEAAGCVAACSPG